MSPGNKLHNVATCPCYECVHDRSWMYLPEPPKPPPKRRRRRNINGRGWRRGRAQPRNHHQRGHRRECNSGRRPLTVAVAVALGLFALAFVLWQVGQVAAAKGGLP